MKKFAIWLIMLFLLLGCARKQISGSYVGDLPHNQAVSAIADDTAIYLSEEYAPGQTSLYLAAPPDFPNEFSMALDTSLRRKGFTILQDNSANSVVIDYTLDSLNDDNNGTWYLRLRFSDGKTVARVYDSNGLPVAGRSAYTLKPDKAILQPKSDL